MSKSRLSVNTALWASAFVLAAVLVVQAGRNADNQVNAEMVSSNGSYVTMTTQGQNGELLYVIDNLNEKLMVYDVEQQRNLIMQNSVSLPEVFRTMRAAAGQ